jgi:inositol-phosphate phosphatase/L-galactose 1-phosphate phosphatase
MVSQSYISGSLMNTFDGPTVAKNSLCRRDMEETRRGEEAPPQWHSQLEGWLAAAQAAAREAGAVIKEAVHKPKNVERKSLLDFVTDTDKECERLILSRLQQVCPDHVFIGEETSVKEITLGDGPTWMIDPLDGTTNFLHGFPYICVSIGLVIARKVQLAVVFAPLLDEMYTAIRGHGAFLNGRELKVSSNKMLETSLLATGFPKYREHLNFQIAVAYQALVSNVQALRAGGSAVLDLCGVASGRLDISLQPSGVCCWDFCAGSLLVLEAGGVVLDPYGGELDLVGTRVLAAACPELAQATIDIIKNRSLPTNVGQPPSY